MIFIYLCYYNMIFIRFFIRNYYLLNGLMGNFGYWKLFVDIFINEFYLLFCLNYYNNYYYSVNNLFFYFDNHKLNVIMSDLIGIF
jgi:hypothetical protein